RAASLILQLICEGNIVGYTILLTSLPNTGKIAIVMGLAKSLGQKMPFSTIFESELFFLEMSKIKTLT
ncbi:putative RuvB-like protein 1, partial [Cocos nucifera]|nr:putative RuvB-like protein 1 [Cocos nucifera]